jgi:chromosome condensin MukBEF complex kleisin-like MukF subunit
MALPPQSCLHPRSRAVNGTHSSIDSLSSQDINRTVRTILAERRSLQLLARDTALLVLLRHYLSNRNDPSPFLAASDVRSITSRLAIIEGSDRQNAEKSATDQLDRLLRSGCLARADMRGFAADGIAEYQITQLGEAIADWEYSQSEFSGAPLETILQVFNDNLLTVADSAEAAASVEDWKKVDDKAKFFLKEILVLVQRHQTDLDARHRALRDFIPELIRQGSENSIDRCREQVDRVHGTILDLHQVTLTTVNAARGYLTRIEQAGTDKEFAGVELLCTELSRHLDGIVRWTEQRYTDWVSHHSMVHEFLRTIIGVHRQRRITEALSRSLSEVPTWTLLLPDEALFLNLREDWAVSRAVSKAPRRAKRTIAREVDIIPDDDLPELLHAWLGEEVACGEILLTRLLRRAHQAGKPMAQVIFHLPWLMGQMTQLGRVDPTARAWTPIADGVLAQELRVNPYAIHR